jgi:hypothetical protein
MCTRILIRNSAGSYVPVPSYAVYLLLHAGEDEGHGPASVRRRHRGAVHELGAAQRELPHGGDGAAGGAQRQPPVPVNSRSAGAPRELGPCGYTMIQQRSQKSKK